jgi:hypothetical protein
MNAEIIMLPERKKERCPIAADDLILLVVSVLKMAKEYLTADELMKLKKHI